MVYVTGDTHADLTRLTTGSVRRLKRGDVLLICGDFGFVWDGGRKEERVLRRLSRLPYTIAFADGRHENYDKLLQYPVEEWHDGTIHRLTENVIHLMRGEIYTLEGHSYFVFGGGESRDSDMRTPSESWWPEEMPTAEEMNRGLDNLRRHGNRVDYIVTHEPSGRTGGYIVHGKVRMDGVNLYLNAIEDMVEYGCWFFGSVHMDRAVSKRHIALFRRVLAVNDVVS